MNIPQRVLPSAVMSVMAGLSGCVDHVWCNPNASSGQALSRAQYACKTGDVSLQANPRPEITVNTDPHALRSVGGDPVNGNGMDPFEFKACMEKSGYHYVTQKQCDAMNLTGTPAKTGLPLE
jgi:hypothetical protein